MKCLKLHFLVAVSLVMLKADLTGSLIVDKMINHHYPVLEAISLPFKYAAYVIRSAIDIVAGKRISFLMTLLKKTCSELTKKGIMGRSGEVNLDRLSLLLQNKDNSDIIKLKDCEKLLESKAYHKDRNMTIFIPGWLNKKDGGIPIESKELIESYKELDEYNFVVYDLHVYLHNLYSIAAYNVHDAGQYLGECLAKIGESIEEIHLIGHSLGAAIAAKAAEVYQAKKKKKISRITGLDPSEPCSVKYLSKDSAEFVDVIHTCEYFGTTHPVGHIDFYANRVNFLSPGCKDQICTHFRAISFFAESVRCPDSFEGTLCSSYLRFARGKCAGNKKVIMGLDTPHDARGIFYLKTNRSKPYGECTHLGGNNKKMNGGKGDDGEKKTSKASEEKDEDDKNEASDSSSKNDESESKDSEDKDGKGSD